MEFALHKKYCCHFPTSMRKHALKKRKKKCQHQQKRAEPYLGNQLSPRCSVLEKRILSCSSYSGLQFNSRSSLDSNSLFLLSVTLTDKNKHTHTSELIIKPYTMPVILNSA